jgi:hypothetical protein
MHFFVGVSPFSGMPDLPLHAQIRPQGQPPTKAKMFLFSVGASPCSRMPDLLLRAQIRPQGQPPTSPRVVQGPCYG